MSNIYGVVSEFNPFHYGHEHLIDSIKSHDRDAVIVSVMSGNFVQRGHPAILDKWKRAEVAIKGGVDLVVELPAVYAVQSADIFAASSMKILCDLGVNRLAFGTELGDIDKLENLAYTMLYSEDYNQSVKYYLGEGYSYAVSSMKALQALGFDIEIKSNDTLALAYIKQSYINSYGFEFYAVKRIGEDYNSMNPSSIASATYIRSLLHGKLVNYSVLKELVPEYSYQMLLDDNNYPHLDDFGPFYFANILSRTEEELNHFDYSGDGLVNRLLKNSNTNKTLSNIIRETATKRYNESVISRKIVQIMLGIDGEFASEESASSSEYIRVLAMNERGKKVLKCASKNRAKTVINFNRDIKKKNITGGVPDYDIRATGLYSLVSHSVNMNSDYLRKPYIVTN